MTYSKSRVRQVSRLFLVNVALLLVAARTAAAPSEIDRAAAQKLFDDAMELMQKAQYHEACTKFEGSQRLDPAMGTQFNLADCFEKTGRMASAWVNFIDVADAALKSGAAEREQVARERASLTASKLSYVTIKVTSPCAGMTVKRDDSDIGQSLWGMPMPIDAGMHIIVASAPGRIDWSKSLEVKGEGAKVEIEVPALIAAPAAGEQKPQPMTRAISNGPTVHVNVSSTSSQKAWAIMSAGLGVVGLSVGTTLVVLAEKKHSGSDPYCNGSDCWDTRGTDARVAAKRLGDWANLPFGIGIAGLGLGAVLWLTAPSTSAETSRTSVSVGPGGVLVNGRF
jgi:hypothetical protein